MTMTIREKIKAVNEYLKRGEPGNITVDRQGRAGYTPQAIVDSMNAVFEFGEWGFEELENRIVESTDKVVHTVSQVQVWLAVDGEKLAFQPTAWGGGTQPAHAIADCFKSSQTDALKKALSYFSVGNRAFHGLLNAPRRGE